MMKRLWKPLFGILMGLLIVVPYCTTVVPLDRDVLLTELVQMLSPIAKGTYFIFWLREMLIYVILVCVFCNYVMQDVEQNYVYVFPRTQSRLRWFYQKIIGLFWSLLEFVIPLYLVVITVFIGINGWRWPQGLLAECVLYLVTTVVFGYYIFVLAVNVFTLFMEKWLAMVLGLTLWGIQFLVWQLRLTIDTLSSWMGWLPFCYTKFSVWSIHGDVPHLSFWGLLLIEVVWISFFVGLGSFVVTKRIGRAGELL